MTRAACSGTIAIVVLHPPYPVHRTIETEQEYAATQAEIQALIDLSVRRTREEEELLEHLQDLIRNYGDRRTK